MLWQSFEGKHLYSQGKLLPWRDLWAHHEKIRKIVRKKGTDKFMLFEGSNKPNRELASLRATDGCGF